ncbi:RTA1-domain-containing protein [Thozetella sp. PMI_491]|nr:RTA1-domain-containing protein [Thozetella sp. PMI_491]
MDPSHYLNFSSPYFNPSINCTLDTCPLEWAQIRYVPSLGGNAFLLAVFALFLLAQAVFAFLYRTWSYNIPMVLGLVLEIVGYVARLQMHDNPFRSDPFIMYLVTVTIAPAFFTAGIYLCFSRVIRYYGVDVARFSTRFYTIAFISSDLLALVLQAAGGGLATVAVTIEEKDRGVNIMIAGLAWQVFSLVVFTLLCFDFRMRVFFLIGSYSRHCTRLSPPANYDLAMTLAVVFIFVRSVFRCAELSKGFQSDLANDQVTYMILEGTMMVLATALLTVFQPGTLFRDNWSNKKPSKGKPVPAVNEVSASESGSFLPYNSYTETK